MKKTKILFILTIILGLLCGLFECKSYIRHKEIMTNDSYVADMLIMEQLLNKMKGKKYSSIYEYYNESETGKIEFKEYLSAFRTAGMLRNELIEKSKNRKLSEQEFNYICDFEIYNNNGNVQVWNKFMPTLAVEFRDGKTVYYGLPQLCLLRVIPSSSNCIFRDND